MTYGVQEKSMKKCVPIIVVSFVTFVLLHMSEHVKLFPKGGGGGENYIHEKMGDIRYRYLRFKLINDFCTVNKSKILLKCASLLKVLNSGHFTRNLYRYCYKSTATGLT